ncbi:MAG: hypothetical protein ACREVJ_05215, partial [Gammaproteobacteria bacterium]
MGAFTGESRAWLFACLIGVGMLLAAMGCGGAVDEGDSTSEGPPDRRAFEGDTLNLVLNVGYEREAIQEYVGEFEEATGATVEIEVFDEPTARQRFILD